MKLVMSETALTWFEIAVADMERAKKFYETVLGKKMIADGTIFPYTEGEGIGGMLGDRPTAKPGAGGTTVYLRVEGSVSEAEARVESAGGKVLVPRFAIPEAPGEIFMMRDTEGNVLGVHGGF